MNETSYSETQKAGRTLGRLRAIVQMVQDNLLSDYKAGKIDKEALTDCMRGAEEHYRADISLCIDILFHSEFD